ncbi:hypothetical protein Tco_0704300 [Tanacetum coccineum]|uniref:Uncharacterized protein n=1 Tax=Tanacetum coccineum TaxID=301880 RepID=A0ABQ4Y1D1_9ASTR
MLERGSYIPWVSRFRRYLNQKRENKKWLNKAIDEGPYVFKNYTPLESQTPRMQIEDVLTGDDLKHYEDEIQAMNLILISIPNEIYNSVDACTIAKAMWERVERLIRGTVQKKVNREIRFNNEFDQFVAEPGKALASVYNLRKVIMLVIVQSQNFKIQILHGTDVSSKQDEAGVTLTEEHNDFLVVDATRMEEIEELKNQEQKYPKQPKIINDTIGHDQIDINIIFDEPNEDVNSGRVEYDKNGQASYKLEQLARNAYKEAEKQQINANKVKGFIHKKVTKV